MKKLTKIMNALKGRGESKSLYLNLHRCSRDDIKAIVRKLPKEIIMEEREVTGTNWIRCELKGYEDFSSIELALFLKKDEAKEEVS